MQTNQLGKAIEVFNELLSQAPNGKQRVTDYGNIGFVYSKMGEYPKTLLFDEKALKIHKLSLGDGHPLTKYVVKRIEFVKKKLLFVDYRLILPESI
jgi:tetratricopeptide (TPR) repeat protein